MRDTVPSMLILSGLPASGKSTYAKKWVAEEPGGRYRLNYDDLRREMYGPEFVWNRLQEDLMKVEAVKRVTAAINLGHDVVIDNCNLTPRVRDHWRNIANNLSVTNVEEHELDVPVRECVQRDELRGDNRVGRAVIERMALFNGHIDWKDPEQYAQNIKFVVVDMDGTLASCQHRVKYLDKNWCLACDRASEPKFMSDKCAWCGTGNLRGKKDYRGFFAGVAQDPPIPEIVDLVRLLSMEHYILIVSGRPTSDAGISTEEWLKTNNISYKHLFMRNGGDHRDDFIVKQEICDLLPKDRIAFVLDDRDQVVKMWRDNGIKCLQVADGNF